MYTVRMKVTPEDTLESLTERAIDEASETGVGRSFEFQGMLYHADPAPRDLGVLQCLGPVRPREATPDDIAILAIGVCSAAMPREWTLRSIGLEALESNRILLVSGRSVSWLREVWRELRGSLPDSLTDPTRTTQRRIELRNGTLIYFETYNSIRKGMRFDCAFIEDNLEGFMAGNYNEFPWSTTTTPERRIVKFPRRYDDPLDTENRILARMKELAAKVAVEGSADEAAAAKIAFRTATSVVQMEMQAKAQIEKNMLDLLMRPSPLFREVSVDNESKSFAGMQRGRGSDPEDRLLTVASILLPHLKDQVRKAPSPGAVYADGPGYVITANDVAKVISALEYSVEGNQFRNETWNRPFWGLGSDPGSGVDVSAQAEDGSKVVLSNSFKNGVLFDPKNRPIRKFRLTEEVSS